jgi:hypothetical protein
VRGIRVSVCVEWISEERRGEERRGEERRGEERRGEGVQFVGIVPSSFCLYSCVSSLDSV